MDTFLLGIIAAIPLMVIVFAISWKLAKARTIWQFLWLAGLVCFGYAALWRFGGVDPLTGTMVIVKAIARYVAWIAGVIAKMGG